MRRVLALSVAIGASLSAPVQAIEIRVDPAPLYVFDIETQRGISDIVLHNILVVNNEKEARTLSGLRVELLAGGEIVAVSRVPAAALQRRAGQIAGLEKAGLLKALDFQFHLSRLLKAGESLSADPVLTSGEAYLNASLYVSAPAAPDAAHVVAEGAQGELGRVVIPVSRRQSAVKYRAPVAGRWFVAASGDASRHHRWAVSSEYAIDVARLLADGRSYRGDGTKLAQYPTFGARILAAADGVVVAARDDRSDNEGMLRKPGMSYSDYEALVAEAQQATLMTDGFEGAAGNHVLIRHENGEHSLYAHLRQKSLKVKVGDKVAAGRQIAEAGNSGNSTEPHLHFQIIDGPDLNSARGLPVSFEGLVEDWYAIGSRHLRAGDFMEQASAGR